MKILKTGIFCLLLFLCAAHTSAQLALQTKNPASKPELFHDLPQHMALDLTTLTPLFQKAVGEKVVVSLAPGRAFSAVVVSKSEASEARYKTIVLKLVNRPGAAFTLTGVRAADGSYRYSGRMLSLKHSDAFEVVESNGQLALQKIPAAELVSE